MVLLKAQRLQRLAEKLGRIESRLARASGDLEEESGAEEAGPRGEARSGGEGGAAEGDGSCERALDEAAARAGADLAILRQLDGATLAETLSPGSRPDPGRFWVVAEILYLDALRAEAAGEGAAERRLRKARLLYQRAGDVAELPAGAPTAEARLAAIEQRLAGGGAG